MEQKRECTGYDVDRYGIVPCAMCKCGKCPVCEGCECEEEFGDDENPVHEAHRDLEHEFFQHHGRE